ncbi:MAG: FAD-dependent oxidoreductase [bacterium]|nr:FAD-dependent oxidoreductase [bacterium]
MGSNYKHVFTPLEIRGIDFKNRIALAPVSVNHCDNVTNKVTPGFVNFHRQFARGGVATMYAGNCSIDITEARDEECQLDLSDDSCVLPLSWYAEMAKEYQCHASLELNHSGNQTDPASIGGQIPWSSSAITPACELSRAKREGREPFVAREMSKAKIQETIEKFAKAAERMKRAGMDNVLLHGGHGNLIAQFTSPMYNKRTDEYGGDTKGRARFALELVDAIRQTCGEDFVIEYRISADEIAPEGMHFPETLELIGLLKQKVDMFNISAGLHLDFDFKYYYNWCQNYIMPHGFNVHYARAVKEAHPDTLVDAVGSIYDLDYANYIIGQGWVDFVAMGRELICDPDMPRKYATNHPEDHRPCLRCDRCARRLFGPRELNCAVNPYSGLTSFTLPDLEIPKAPEKKRCAVVGGGPAGIVAALALEKRGHEVTLYEKSAELGGCLRAATAPEFKSDLARYLEYLRVQAGKSKTIDFRMGTEATPEMLEAEGYDAAIIALGGKPVVPPLPGIDKPHVRWAADALADNLEVGSKVAVLGAGVIAIEAAWEYLNRGKEVTLICIESHEQIVEAFSRVGTDRVTGQIYEQTLEMGMKTHYASTIKRIEDDRLVVLDADGNESVVEASAVLYAWGMRSRMDDAAPMRRIAPETDVYVVGDCKRIGEDIPFAVNGAFQAAIHI